MPAGGTPEGVAVFTVPLDQPPSIGAYRSEDHRYWWNGQGPFPGATSVLDVLSKPAVTQWKAMETARVCIREWMELSRVLESEGEDAAVNWAVKASDRKRDEAAAFGTSIHLLADMEGVYAQDPVAATENTPEGFQVAIEAIPYLEAFRSFLALYGAENIISSEKMVWSLTGYGGTYDLLMQIPHNFDHQEPCPKCNRMRDTDMDLWLIDIKTSKGFYPEYGLQLAAYRWADQIILPGDPTVYPMPHIHRTGVLHLRPDLYPDTGWRLIEYPTTELDYLAFLSTLNLYQWKSLKRFRKSQLVGRNRSKT
jgi:hypothetical protein